MEPNNPMERRKLALTWSKSEAQANDILRGLMRSTKYPWSYRKLNRARLYLIDSRHQFDWRTVIETVNSRT
jgi:hypothetical protein